MFYKCKLNEQIELKKYVSAIHFILPTPIFSLIALHTELFFKDGYRPDFLVPRLFLHPIFYGVQGFIVPNYNFYVINFIFGGYLMFHSDPILSVKV